MKHIIGKYTWQKGVPVYNSDLVDYFKQCVKGVLKKPKWWKQEQCTKEIIVTIEIKEK